jgi:hypothetical protein
MEQYSTGGRQRKAELLVAAYGGAGGTIRREREALPEEGPGHRCDEREDEGELFLQVGLRIRRPRSEFTGRAD